MNKHYPPPPHPYFLKIFCLVGDTIYLDVFFETLTKRTSSKTSLGGGWSSLIYTSPVNAVINFLISPWHEGRSVASDYNHREEELMLNKTIPILQLSMKETEKKIMLKRFYGIQSFCFQRTYLTCCNTWSVFSISRDFEGRRMGIKANLLVLT